MLKDAFRRSRLRRALGMPLPVLAPRLLHEARLRTRRFTDPRRAARFDAARLLRETGRMSLDDLWNALSNQPHAALIGPPGPGYGRLCPGDRDRVLREAERALARRVNLLGSGEVDLGQPVDWALDPKSGKRWPNQYADAIDYADLNRASDVKLPWEISRLQWLIPAGQAYLLTGDERYAKAARTFVEEWIAANPYAGSVNWCIAMEPALRIMSWTWLFHACCRSISWSDPAFRERFMVTLYLHADFVERHLERAHINGNHFTANAAGLVFAGCFFGSGEAPTRWLRKGWAFLCDELPRQVYPDGVDFEGSTAYHRLVGEFFLLPALYRKRLGLSVAAGYSERLVAMGTFCAAYSRADGSSPRWGDADDGRALPLGGQALGDHRYLVGAIGVVCEAPQLVEAFDGSVSEVYWLCGAEAAERLVREGSGTVPSAAFQDGGVYVMRTKTDHVFIDCGPVGLAGRGGHGHNDCLAFEATLNGVLVIADCGSYVYTASPAWRNRFRSTAFHNTPMVDGQEQNRDAEPPSLWHLSNDAEPIVSKWMASRAGDHFIGSHGGYRRLSDPVVPTRHISLDHDSHRLTIRDEFAAQGPHRASIPFHLAPGLTPTRVGPCRWRLTAGDREFDLKWSGDGWRDTVRDTWISPSYGVKELSVCLELVHEGMLAALTVTVAPK